MDHKKLRYFLAVAEESHFRRAADRLHIAQSALSRQMQALEAEIGYRLFDRFVGGTKLTAAGEVFREEAARLLHSYESAVLRVRRAAQGAVGSLSIAVNEIAIRNDRVLSSIKSFREQESDIALGFQVMTSQEQLDALHGSAVDVGFLFASSPDQRLFGSCHIYTDTYDLLIPRSHPLAAKPEIFSADLRNEHFIVASRSYNRYYWDLIFGHLMAKGIIPDVVQEVNNETAIFSLVSVNLGLSFCHRSNGDRLPQGVVLRPVSDLHFDFSLLAIWRKDNRSEALRHFTRVLGANSLDWGA